MTPTTTNDQVRDLGYEPTRRGWKPLNDDVTRRLDEADARRTSSPRRPAPVVIEGRMVPCLVCERPAEPSLVGTPTCSPLCTGILAAWTFPQIAEVLREHGSPGVVPPPKPAPANPPIREGVASVGVAVQRLGDVHAVLERHHLRVRGRMAYCPFHPNERTPAMSIYERDGKSRATCHACGWSGDVLDLEAALAGEDLATTIRRWGR